MEQCKEPTREQEAIIANHKLNMRNWLVVEETETHLIVQYKYGSDVRELDKSINLWKEN